MKPIYIFFFLLLLASSTLAQGVTQLPGWHAFRGNPYYAPTIMTATADTASYSVQAFYYNKITPLPDTLQPTLARNVGALSVRWSRTNLLPELVWVQIKRAGVTVWAANMAINKQPDTILPPTALTVNYVYNGPMVIPNITEKSIWYELVELLYK